MKTILGIIIFLFGGPLLLLGWFWLCSLIPLPFPRGFIIFMAVPIVLLWISTAERSGGDSYPPEEDAGGL